GIYACCAAAAGSSPTSACCRAAIATKYRLTPIRMPSDFVWPAVFSVHSLRKERTAMKTLLCALVLLAAPALAAQQQPPPSIVTSGEGVVKKAPDRAFVTIAAESRAKTATEAQRANADAMNAVLEKIKAAGIPP